MRRSYLFAALLASYAFGQNATDFLKVFDKQESLTAVAGMFVDQAAEHGKEGVKTVLSSPTSTYSIDDFISGLVEFKRLANSNWKFARQQMSFTSLPMPAVREIAKSEAFQESLARYYAEKVETKNELLSYLARSEASQVIELGISQPNGRVVMKWYLFFRGSKAKRWRLEEAVPYVQNPAALRGNWVLSCTPGRT